MVVAGLIGGVQARGSLSPRMHTRAMALAGIEGSYGLFIVEPPELPAAVEGVRALGMSGVNVTVPYKQAVVELVAELSPEARAIGAVNTIVRDGSRLVGHNTDARGFLVALGHHRLDPSGRRIVVLGAGGAARAVVWALAGVGADVVVAARRDEAAAQLAAQMGVAAGQWQALEELVAQAHCLVNATTVSTADEDPALARRAGGWRVREWVVDLNYGRSPNMWQALASRSGAAFADGLAMLAAQGAMAMRLWSGVRVGLEVYLEALG